MLPMKKNSSTVTKKAVAIATLTCMVSAQTAFAAPLVLSQQPLYIGSSVTPKVMLTLSKDQQLFKKAYNDYSDLDGDGVIEATYKHSIDYYGYFDPKKCYIYRNNRFEPERVTEDKYCGQSNEWAGNFLNWVSMSRMDAVRKLLYGGTRSTDGASTGDATAVVTVLERAYIPSDAHAWAKYYDGADIPKLTPFAVGTGVRRSSSTATAISRGPQRKLSRSQRAMPRGTSSSIRRRRRNISVGDQIRLKNASGSLLGAVLDITNSGHDVKRPHRPERVCRDAGGEHDVGCDQSQPHRHLVLQRDAGPWKHHWNRAVRGRQVVDQSASASDSRGARQLCSVERKRTGAVPVGGAQLEPSVGLRRRAQQRKPGCAVGDLLERRESQSLGDRTANSSPACRCASVRSDGDTDLLEENCHRYPSTNTYKPVGLLQKFGEPNDIHFGLMTEASRAT